MRPWRLVPASSYSSALGDGARVVVRPRGLELLLDAEPLGEVELALVDAREEIADGVDAEPAVLQLRDELEPLAGASGRSRRRARGSPAP